MCRACSNIDLEQVVKPESYDYRENLKEWLKSVTACQLCLIFFDNCTNVQDSALEDLFTDKTKSENYSVVL